MKRFAAPAFAGLLAAGCAAASFAQAPALAPGFVGAPLAQSVPSDLPRVARPLHYRIEVVPDAANLTFSGTTSIDIEVYERTAALTLHANELTFAQHEPKVAPHSRNVAPDRRRRKAEVFQKIDVLAQYFSACIRRGLSAFRCAKYGEP